MQELHPWAVSAYLSASPKLTRFNTKWLVTDHQLIVHIVPGTEDPYFDENHPILRELKAQLIPFYAQCGTDGRLIVNFYRS